MPCMRDGDCICGGIRQMGCAYWRNIGDVNWRHPDDELEAIMRDVVYDPREYEDKPPEGL